MNFSTLILSVVIFLISFRPSLSTAQKVDWLLHVDGIAGQQLVPTVENTIARDANGNIFMTSAVADSSQLGEFIITGSELVPGVFLHAYYLTKLDPNGVPLWVQIFKGTGEYVVYDMAIDINNDVYLIGRLAGAVTIDSTNFESNFSAGDMMLTKFSNDGDLLWTSLAESQPGFSNSRGYTVATGPNGNVVVGGTVDNHVRFEGVAIDVLHENLFMASYTSEGNINWARPYGNIYALQVSSDLEIGSNGEIYWVGNTGNNASSDITTFDDISFEPFGGSMFVAKFEANGDIVWLNHYSEAPESLPDMSCSDIAVNPNNNSLIIAGSFADTVEVESATLVEPNIIGKHFFVAKFNATGALEWIQQNHGLANDVDVFDIDLNASGDVYVGSGVGSTIGLTDYILGIGPNSKSFEINGNMNGVLAKYKSNGELDWLKGISGFDLSQFRAVAAVGENTVVSSGAFTEEIQIGGMTLEAGPETFSGNVFVVACTEGNVSTHIKDLVSPVSLISSYPNPAKDFITISAEKPLSKLSLISLDGRILFQQNKPDPTTVFHISHLPKGIYFIKGEGDTGTTTQKLILH